MKPALLLLLLTLAACAPVTVSITLFGEASRLWETELQRERGSTHKVAIIDVRGVMADRASGLLVQRPNPVDELTAQLQLAESDRRVAAVIIRINSPGGTVAASEMMHREIRDFSQRSGKPVVASFGEVAASGGYYLALAADHIIAEPTSITGSIGVIIPTFNFSQGLNRIGIYSRSVTSVDNKDIANPFEPMNEEHYAILKSMADEFHGQFQGTVALRRGEAPRRNSPAPDPSARHGTAPALPTLPKRFIDPDRLAQITDGRIMTGLQALNLGLIDETGGIPEAFHAAKALAGLHSARLVKYFREDAGRPRTAYAAAGMPPAEGAEINILQIRTGSSGLTDLHAGIPYYLYIAPMAH
jgi:protease IV